METIEIRQGLRKLEFEKPREAGGESTFALVEFVRDAPLQDGQAVRVSLGSRHGVLRELIGVPKYVNRQGGTSKPAYLYQLRAAVVPIHR